MIPGVVFPCVGGSERSNGTERKIETAKTQTRPIQVVVVAR